MVRNSIRSFTIRLAEIFRMKRLLPLILLIGITSLFPQRRKKGSNLGIPEFEVSTPVYPEASADSVRLDVLIKIPYASIQFLKQGSTFVAEFETAVLIYDDKEQQVIQKRWKRRIETINYDETISKKPLDLEIRSFVLSLGEYNCKIEVTDLDTHKTGKKSVELKLDRFKGEVVLSDLLLINQQLVHDKFPQGVPIIPPKISGKDSSLSIFYKARLNPGDYTITIKSVTPDGDVLAEEVVTGVSEGTFISGLMYLPAEHVSNKRFKIEAVLNQNANKSESVLLVEVKWRGLSSHVEDLDVAIEQIRYIASSKTYRKMVKAKSEKKERLFREFWDSKDPSPGTSKNELMNEYYMRINLANEKFGSFQDGWKTSMGMIYVLFGMPDDIQYTPYGLDGRAYQRWHYYKVSRSFLFVDRNGFGDYELVEPYFPYGRD